MLHSHQQWMTVPISPYACQHLVLVFQTLVILIGESWYLVLIYIFLMTYAMEHLFKCVSTNCVSFMLRSMLRFCPFYNWVAFLSLSLKSSLHILDKNPLLDIYSKNTFFPDCGLTSHYVDIVFHRTAFFPFFILIKSKLLCLFFMDLPLILYLKSHGLSQGRLDFPLWYLLRILQFCFLHLSLWFLLSFFFFLFVKGIKTVSNFFCMWLSNCFSTVCCK